MAGPTPTRPYLERFWTVWALGEHEVELRSLGRSVRLAGSTVVERLSGLLPMLDGTRTTPEVCEAFPGEAREETGRIITQLFAHGLLSDGDSGGPMGPGAPGVLAEWLEALAGPGASPGVHARLERARVITCGIDPMAGLLTGMLTDAGIATRAMGPAALAAEDGLREIAQASVVAAFGASHGDELFARLAAAGRATGTPWLPVACDGVEAHLGPLVLPGRSACLTCYRMRAEALSEAPVRLLRPGSRPMLPGVAQMIAGIAAAEAVKSLLGVERAWLVDRLLTVHLRTLSWTWTDVLRLPRCPGCAGTFRGTGSE